MLTIILSYLFIFSQIIAYSQVNNLLHPFVLENDIDSLSKPLSGQQLSVPSAVLILTRTNYSCLNSCGVLSVQLLSFDAERKSDSVVKVTWKTTNEINNKKFVVQRSQGNNHLFIDVGWLAADDLPAMTHSYTFLDENDYEHISYYRLQQVDSNNEFSYSRIVAVKGNPLFESISAYPNPSTTNVLVDVRLKKMDQVIMDIYNNQGQRIQNQSVNFIQGSNVINLDLAQYQKGIYFIKVIKSDGNILKTAFIKQ